MNFNFTSETVFWLFGIAIFLIGANAMWSFFLERKIKRLLGGTRAQNIEEAMVLIKKDLDTLKAFKKDTNEYLEIVEGRLRRSIQSIETVRFNPFKGTGDGGNQSFSTSFVDEKGDGVIVSGLYSRERISVFSKPIRNYTSEFELTEEEQKVVAESRKKILKRDF